MFAQRSLSRSQFIWRKIYILLLLPLAIVLSYLLSLKNTKLRRSLQGRKGVWERFASQLNKRDLNRPLAWFHVASAGEFLQAQPLIETMNQAGYQYVLTVTSINGYEWVQKQSFEHMEAPVAVDYLPLDIPHYAQRMLAMIQPDVLVYVKSELWPNLVFEAYGAKIPQYLISAGIHPNSKKLQSKVLQSFFNAIYSCLDGIHTITSEDQQRFLKVSPKHTHVHVVGDTRYDSVKNRKARVVVEAIPEYLKHKTVLVLGSSWPEDENCTFGAIQEALQAFPELVVIIVPHEPTEKHLQHGEQTFAQWQPQRWSQRQTSEFGQEPRVILVDTVGQLSAIYQVGNLAYVGGGFTTGVHNTMEPSIMGLPTIFGPKHQNASEAIAMVKKGCAFTVSEPAAFQKVLWKLLEKDEERKELGQAAKAYILSQCGASEQSYGLMRH